MKSLLRDLGVGSRLELVNLECVSAWTSGPINQPLAHIADPLSPRARALLVFSIFFLSIWWVFFFFLFFALDGVCDSATYLLVHVYL